MVKYEKTVIAAASYYNQNYYFCDEFNVLPPKIKKEIKQMVINAANRSKGVFSLAFDINGDIILETGGLNGDLSYDEIEGKMQINKIEQEKADLLKKLILWKRLSTGEKDEKRSEC